MYGRNEGNQNIHKCLTPNEAFYNATATVRTRKSASQFRRYLLIMQSD